MCCFACAFFFFFIFVFFAFSAAITVKTSSIGTYRRMQTVQTKIRLKEQSDLDLHFLPFYFDSLDALSHSKTNLYNI